MGECYRWNPDKAAANRRDHGIAFEDVGAAFRDPFAVEWIDDREDYGEERVNMLAIHVRRHPTPCDVHGMRRAHSPHLGPAGGAP